MTDSERLLSVIKWSNLTINAFSKKVGYDRSVAFYDIKNNKPGKSNISKAIAENICNIYSEISLGWLLTGEGEMLKQDIERDESEKIKPNYINSEETVNTIPLLPISAFAGKLNDFKVSIKETDCERIISPIKNADFALTVYGDSMQPEYQSGSQILVKKIDETAFIDWGKVYVIDTLNGTLIKKIIPSVKEGYIRCLSINPEYPPVEVPLTSVFGIYRVMLCMSMK